MKIELSQAQKMLEWLKIKLFLDSKASTAKKRSIRRGQVYRCNFGCGIGSEMQKDRPAVVIQNDIGNLHSANTIVIPITHDQSSLPCTANITPVKDQSGQIILDGQANASNLMCVSKARLGNLVCVLSNADMKQIDEAIAKATDLMGYYADISNKLSDKLAYISRLKTERNQAQDELSELRKIFGLNKNESIVNFAKTLQNSVDIQ